MLFAQEKDGNAQCGDDDQGHLKKVLVGEGQDVYQEGRGVGAHVEHGVSKGEDCAVGIGYPIAYVSP